MAAEFKVEIVTPEKVRYEGTASALTLPGASGEMGVLAHHEPLVALLDPGHTRLQTSDGAHLFASGEGFVQIHDNKATVIVEFAETVDEVNRAAAEESLSKAQAALAEQVTTEEVRRRTMTVVKAAQARLSLRTERR
ncbi:MAG TPA: ATP synthase F1 subunit epsilon [Candidatus Xenobia bacterium]|jgi:F-type H+-transporting ATPase subunit epsilon